MASQTKVMNLTSGLRIKRSQARNRVEQGLSAWVDENFTIRDLSLAEMMAVRAEQSRRRAPIASAEIPGIKVTGIVQDFALIRAANQYAQEATA